MLDAPDVPEALVDIVPDAELVIVETEPVPEVDPDEGGTAEVEAVEVAPVVPAELLLLAAPVPTVEADVVDPEVSEAPEVPDVPGDAEPDAELGVVDPEAVLDVEAGDVVAGEVVAAEVETDVDAVDVELGVADPEPAVKVDPELLDPYDGAAELVDAEALDPEALDPTGVTLLLEEPLPEVAELVLPALLTAVPPPPADWTGPAIGGGAMSTR